MMKYKLQNPKSFSLSPKPSINSLISHGRPSLISILPGHHMPLKHNKKKSPMVICAKLRPSPGSTDATTSTDQNKPVTIKVVVTAKLRDIGILSSKTNFHSGRTILLGLLSSELDPETKSKKETIKGYVYHKSEHDQVVIYENNFTIPAGFGEVGAVEVETDEKEIFIKSIELNDLPNGRVNVPCNSWVHYKFGNPQKRIFFTNKSYLPSKTPSGLERVRKLELENLRGNGQGQRNNSDRIYDYDTYNDLGYPESRDDLARPVLGGEEHPYPRRCRTGRPPTKKDPLSEQRSSSSVYVPRDEAFEEGKEMTFSAKAMASLLHALLHLSEKAIDPILGFPDFTAIDSLFNEGVTFPKPKTVRSFQTFIPRLVKACNDDEKLLLRFERPEIFDRDKCSLYRDEEFSRQTLAGLNPFSIELVKEWPLKSKLDPKIYGPPESLITTELVEKEIEGFMTVDKALETKKLFILDYHDLYMPYVNKVRNTERTPLYGSRTLLFLTEDGTLRPVAIELTRPPDGDESEWKKVFTPTQDATGCWLWRLAKAHVCAHDAGYHQLVIHWLRTHCATEPYIIAANRQLSAMHPIYRLLHPHFRHTMEINALAREILINAGGIIERCFSPGKYSMELSSAAYDQLWRFDTEALPADLIRRGMAVQDPEAEHGLNLTIKDYPFANDGLILWDAIKEWVGDYVNHYYHDPTDPTLVQSDKELQGWWTEVRTKGHADKKDETWWPVLETSENLIHILTTIIWVTSGHHAAVNFGQYMYAGYFPNKPTIARTNMPTDDPSGEYIGEVELLKCFPSQFQATTVMAALDMLSNHSTNEEYIGEKLESSWAENPVINDAFKRFNGNLKRLEIIINERNTDKKLKNRVGEGVVPYELLKPFSTPGVTGMGVPNSISI